MIFSQENIKLLAGFHYQRIKDIAHQIINSLDLLAIETFAQESPGLGLGFGLAEALKLSTIKATWQPN